MIDDALLMEKAAAGDKESFRLLVKKYREPVFNFFLRSTGSREDSEDLLQNLFLALLKSARRYRKTASFKTYIYRIASNMLVSYYRGRKDHFSMEGAAEDSGGFEYRDQSPESDPSQNAELSELEEAFSRALAGLPVETAAALELRVKQGFSYKEIAEIMDKSLSAVESMIFRGRKSLAEKMRVYRENEPE